MLTFFIDMILFCLASLPSVAWKENFERVCWPLCEGTLFVGPLVESLPIMNALRGMVWNQESFFGFVWCLSFELGFIYCFCRTLGTLPVFKWQSHSLRLQWGLFLVCEHELHWCICNYSKCKKVKGFCWVLFVCLFFLIPFFTSRGAQVGDRCICIC